LNAQPHKGIGLRSVTFALSIASPIFVYLLSFSACWTCFQALKLYSVNERYGEVYGHPGLLLNFVLGSSVVLARFCLLAVPIPLFPD
jgi:hypothetical protein